MNIGIIGTGAYATSLASILEENINSKNLNLTMWTINEDEYQELSLKHTNSRYLDYELNKNIKFTMDLNKLVLENDTLILAIPAKFVHSTFKTININMEDKKVLIATKGIEPITNELISDYLKRFYNINNITCISGPSFAHDIIKKQPIGLTIASQDKNNLNYFKDLFKTSYISFDETDDIIGCSLCGVIKNIMAIFSGILEGMQINSSTKAKFMVDASKEIMEIIKKLNGKEETFYTYAGLGDLLLTATSTESRNFTFGLLIGMDKDFKTYLEKTTVEGVESLKTTKKILEKNNLNSKIIDILDDIVNNCKDKNIILDFLKK